MSFFFYTFYLPTLNFLKTLFFWLPIVKKRRVFEGRNKQDDHCLSFKTTNQKADLCFEFSSEGEYQQVASLISDALCDGKKLELVFFSPSVEKTIQDLAKKYPLQIRYLRFPLLSCGLNKWVTAKTLIMVRYDLFPELLVWASSKENHLKIIWVTFKKEHVLGKKISFLKKLFLKKASYIVYASKNDRPIGTKLGLSGDHPFFDFRIEQIKRRMEKRHEKFQQLFPLYSKFHQHIVKFPREKRLILGNIWPEDLFLLEKIPQDYLIVVVPHQLNEDVLTKIHQFLKSIKRDALEINNLSEDISPSNTYLINKKGILCELYADFGPAYVGGGFGVSVHSILEPLVAGNDRISCGPKTLRSTEYDLADNFGLMTTVHQGEEFLEWLHQRINSQDIQEQLMHLIELYPVYKKEVLSC
jgi:3-deoxy-D-manno-octulosonic-acid transferase